MAEYSSRWMAEYITLALSMRYQGVPETAISRPSFHCYHTTGRPHLASALRGRGRGDGPKCKL